MSEDNNKSSIVMNTILAAVISAIANAIIFLGASRIAASRGIDALGGQDLITWNTANGTVNIGFVIVASVVTAIGAGIVYWLLKRNDNTFFYIAAIVAVLSMAGPLLQAGPWFNKANVGYGDTVALGLMHIVSAIVSIIAHTYNSWKDTSVVNVPDFNYDRKLKTAGIGGASLAAAGAVGAASLKASAPKVSTPKVNLKASAPKVAVTAPKADFKAPKVEVKKPDVKVAAKAPAKKVEVTSKAKVDSSAKVAGGSTGDDLTRIEGIGPAVAATLAAAGITTYAQLGDANAKDLQGIIDKDGRFSGLVARTWPVQARLARDGKWDKLQEAQAKYDLAEAPKKVGGTAAKAKPSVAAAGAAATGAAATGAVAAGVDKTKASKPAKPDDLTKIEGIGPKISSLLRAAGISTFADLAKSDVSKIQSVLDAAGPRFKIAKPGTWPEQAALAAAGNWDGLEKLQDILDGGVRK